MFTETELTPEQLRSEHIIIAHSEREAYQLERELRREIGRDWILASTAGVILGEIIRRWKGCGATWSILKGMQVLDLASGSKYSHCFPGDKKYTWFPQFARLCAFNGAEVVAVDIHPQGKLDQMLLSWAAEDLVKVVLGQGLQSVPILQGKKFDIIISKDFAGTNFCPELPEQLSRYGVDINEYNKKFMDQAGTLLAEDGVMFLGLEDNMSNRILHIRKGNNIISLDPEDTVQILPYNL